MFAKSPSCVSFPLSLLLISLPLSNSQKSDDKCSVQPTGSRARNEQFFRWSRLRPALYWLPSSSAASRLLCGDCYFPANLRSLSYKGSHDSFVVYHPYAKGQTGESGVKGEGALMCGIRNPEFQYSNFDARKRAPITLFPDWDGDFFNFLRRFDVEDEQVPRNCFGYPCPMLIKIYNSRFSTQHFNGYYISNFVLPGGGSHLPTYKHSSRNIYIWASSDSRRYHVTRYPDSRFRQCLPRLDVEVERPNRVLFQEMGAKYCLSLHTSLKWSETFIDRKTGESRQHRLTDTSVSPLPFQCGLNYRESENHMFSTGTQPYVVRVEGLPKRSQCVGTLVSPQHVLTMANCFYAEEDIFDLNNKMRNKCFFSRYPDANWTDCDRFFTLNRKADGSPAGIRVRPFKNPYNNNPEALPVEWIEFHPLFSGTEYDLAILGLKGTIQRTTQLYPICLPKFKGRRLYPAQRWENYQILYSLKAVYKDIRFKRFRTDVNGPEKFIDCDLRPGGVEGSSNISHYCYSELKDGVFNPPPPVLGDSRIGNRDFRDVNSPYHNEPRREANGKYQCEYFYNILEHEEENHSLKDNERQIRNLQRGVLECFAQITMEFVDQTRRGIRCYERRRRCLREFGWCRVKGEDFGFCGEVNVLNDSPKPGHPLFEVQTFVYPRRQCSNGSLISSPTRICTGHITRAATEYIFQVERDLVGNTDKERVVYEVVEYINGIQRPMVRAPDRAGRIRVLKSALEGVCHGAGSLRDVDNGAPTYFRYPVQETWSGQDQEPGNAYAILYSLQKSEGRFCDFYTYYDTEVLIAHEQVMDWLETVISEVSGFRQFYDPSQSKIALDLKVLRITTTSSTTQLDATTTDFGRVWAFSEPFVRYRDHFLPLPWRAYWNKYEYVGTKPPIGFVEGYEDMDDDESRAEPGPGRRGVSGACLLPFVCMTWVHMMVTG